MLSVRTLFALVVSLYAANAATDATHANSALVEQTAQTQASLRGTITDPSGALVPSAVVQLRGASATLTVRTDVSGKYAFANVVPGAYTLRVMAKGFTAYQQTIAELNGAQTADVQLEIQADAQQVTVEDETKTVTTDPSSNSSAIVMGKTELEALSDDPDELAQQLQALAGPSTGPDGGQIYIDGFSGGTMPPKSSIREVRINSNPFSPEFDRPGFSRIEIITKPGSDTFHGSFFTQYNNQHFNSRSPLLSESKLPDYSQKFFGLNLGGPIKKQRSSFGLDAERRVIDENAFVYATTLDSNLSPVNVNQGIVTPQTRLNITPRFDYLINTANTLTVRYQFTRVEMDNEGVNGYSLASQAYNQRESDHSLQVTETAMVNPHAVTETRFQWLRSRLDYTGSSASPTINVQGAFQDGGVSIGGSGRVSNHYELSNTTTWTHKTHTVKWGARLRESVIDDTSLSNFNGTFTFFGGTGPELDANNNAIAGTSVQLTALEVYRRTLLFSKLGYTAAQIRALGGGATQFSLNAGAATTGVKQFDAGLFVNDDWKLRSNLTLSYGARYEAQTNLSDWSNIAPRVGLAWGVGGGQNKQAKFVVRLGAGVFYDRIADSVTLATTRFNGSTQQSYFIQNPDFYPTVPTLASLESSSQPQQLQLLSTHAKAPRNYQATASIERQINKYVKLSASYVESRGVHLSRNLNANTPINGVYPYGDSQVRLMTETVGLSRTHQFILAPNVNYKKLFLFGFYANSYGKSDAEGMPQNPYNLRAEWGPSSFADVRHRFLLGSSVPMPLKISLNPFMMISSGTPYTITTGRDPLHTGTAAQRPALLTNVSAGSCTGGDLIYKMGYGCFNLNPGVDDETLGRNSERGPANVSINLRVARSWAFGGKRESNPTDQQSGPPPGMGGVRGGGPPSGGGGPGGGGPPPGGGPPAGMFGGASGKRYSLTLSANIRNVINHANYSTPSGDLSSTYFGEPRSLAGFGPMGGSSTYNRKIDFQLRLTF